MAKFVQIGRTGYNVGDLEKMGKTEFKKWHKKHFGSSAKEQDHIWNEIFPKEEKEGAK